MLNNCQRHKFRYKYLIMTQNEFIRKCSVLQKAKKQTTSIYEANKADDVHFDCEIIHHNSKLSVACWTTTVHQLLDWWILCCLNLLELSI